MKNKILKITTASLLALIAIVYSTPYLFKGRIVRLVKAKAYQDIRAHVSFADVDISWFRQFPRIAIGFNEPRIIGVGEFDGDTLLNANQIDLAVGLTSLLSGDSIDIYSVNIKEPHLKLMVHQNGHRNWDLAQTATPQAASDSRLRPIKWMLQAYAISKGSLNYQNDMKDLTLVITDFNHQGRGDFTADQFVLNTVTTAADINLSHAGAIPYHLNAKSTINIDFQVDNKTNTWAFKTDQISLNELKLQTEGYFQSINDSSLFVNLRFKSPSTEFRNILSMWPAIYQKDFSNIKANGQVVLNGFVKGRYDDRHEPAYHVNLDVDNAFFQYADLPMPVENINLRLHVDNPDGIADHLTVNFTTGHLEINKEPIDFHLLIRNPKSKPFIDFALVGKLNLANASKWVKLDSATRLRGLINASFFAKGLIGDNDKHKKDPFRSEGQFILRNFQYATGDDRAGITLDDLVLAFSPQHVQIQELNGEYRSAPFTADGSLNNFYAYALKNEPLKGSLYIKANELDLRAWMRTGRDSNAYAIPADLSLSVSADVDQLHFDDIDMQHVSGNFNIADETVTLHEITGETLEGLASVNGQYSTKQGASHPQIDLSFNVQGLDVQKTFFAFNTVQKMMPVAKFISGKFNAQMNLKGNLESNLSPGWHSLHGEGHVIVLDGEAKGFGPLEKIAQSLDLSTLKTVMLHNTRADFSLKTEQVMVNPFVIHTDDLDMEVAGMHGFDQSLDYDISLKVPRNKLGSKGKTFVKNVVSQAADKGIPVRLRDAVIMDVKMNGSINNPTLKTDMDGEVDNAANDLKKEVDEFVNAKLDSAKDEVTHHAVAKPTKSLAVQTSVKSKTKTNSKKKTVSKQKSKTTTASKSKTKKKKPAKYYSTSLKKSKTVASLTHK